MILNSRTLITALQLTAFLTISATLGGCNGNGDPLEEAAAAPSCGPMDQRGSYMASIEKNAAVQVTIDDRFSATEKNDILEAISVWNQYGREQLGFNLFSAQSGGVPADSTPQGVDDCGFAGSSGTFAVVRETSNERWTALGLSSNNPAATIRCHSLNRVVRQVVIVNPSHTQAQQFMSVIVHELGHSIGLDHSCTGGSGASDFISCAGLSENHPYKQAVMYPILKTNSTNAELSERKESLRENDRERASCLLR